MNWKTLLWTVIISILIFFTLVFLGMKYQWVRGLQDKKVLENEKIDLQIPKGKPSDTTLVAPILLDEKPPLPKKHPRFSPSLVGEETALVDFTGMPLELVVKECRRISKKVGIPEARFMQSVNECAVRNFQGRTSLHASRSRNVLSMFRKTCKANIPLDQQALLLPEEMKLLIDECVAERHRQR
ncbi:MAG: hypothetical protein KAG28_00930 [Cocleimonas sp.]|nr:hypothetical protein [Cocleimonas sp.]